MNLNPKLRIQFIFVLSTLVIITIKGEQNFDDVFVICPEDNNRCTCSLDGTHWSDVQSKCVALERTSCSEILGCTDNAFCSVNNICHCNEGYSHTGDGHCLPGYGTRCNSSEHSTITLCNSDNFLHCNPQETCVCQPGYSKDRSLCRGQPGQKCDLKVTPEMTKISFCISSATCVPGNITEDGDSSQLRMGTCVCPSSSVVDIETGDITCSQQGSGTRLLLKLEIFLAILITILIF